jgi:peptidoglycan/xylan/chitin deacetylase (PgdA/CDA1 family)
MLRRGRTPDVGTGGESLPAGPPAVNPWAAKSIAILAYHKLAPDGQAKTWYYVERSRFAADLSSLERGGWTVISLAELVRGLEAPETLPDRAALVTFDDAYRSVFEYAYPVLSERGHPAVVFVPAEYVGKTSTFDDHTDEPVEPICTLAELQELERSGISIESHGFTHRRLSRLSRRQVKRELSRSKAFLEDGLAKRISAYAYAYGDTGSNAVVRPLLARCGYRVAFLYGGAAFSLPVDGYAVPRIPLGSDSELASELDEAASPTD